VYLLTNTNRGRESEYFGGQIAILKLLSRIGTVLKRWISKTETPQQ